MAIVRVTPTEIDVKTGLFDRRPRQIRIANESVPVIEIAQVRDELAAYPVAQGPRRIFDEDAPVSRKTAVLRTASGALEHLDGLDVVGVEVGDAVDRVVLVRRAAAGGRRGDRVGAVGDGDVRDDHAVDDEQR